mgnify:CR=1 FL=1
MDALRRRKLGAKVLARRPAVLGFAWSEKNPYQWDPQRKGVFTGQQHHTLDMELFGPNSWITGYYLAALRAAQELARADGDEAAAGSIAKSFQKGSAYVERELFNGRHYIQQINLKRSIRVETVWKRESLLEHRNAGDEISVCRGLRD